MMETTTAAQIVIEPWFRDHHFAGTSILPAVEALEFLARQVHARFPEESYRQMGEARFPRFLELAPEQASMEVWVTLTKRAQGEIRAMLQSKKRLKAMSRLISHCEVVFAGGQMTAPPSPPLQSGEPSRRIDAGQVYQELVPFGPMYRSLRGQIRLESASAYGKLVSPVLPTGKLETYRLGSPFAMDGAMHLACVHGQRLVNFIPFPVGFACRCVHTPTRCGAAYKARALLRTMTAEELTYDLEIVDQEQVRETILGLRMRDVSGGRIKPVAWIRGR